MARMFASYEDLITALKNLGEDDMLPAVYLTPHLAAEILKHDPVNRDVRKGKVELFRREILAGHWDARKSSAMRFLPTGQMADGQHRCLACIAADHMIVVPMTVVPDTVGVDEGTNRTLVDHLRIGHHLDKTEANLVSAVTKALCDVKNPGSRDLLEFFEKHDAFILDSVTKPLGWLAEAPPIEAHVFKPGILVVTRARAIMKYAQPQASVDQLLYDAIQGGVTAPEGSPRRALARQLHDKMHEVYGKKGAKSKDVLTWTRNALHFEREGQIKNITGRLPGEKKKKKPASKQLAMAEA